MFNALLAYYGVSMIYIIIYYIRKKKNWLTQLFILLFCPVVGIIILFEMNREYKDKSTNLPDWLIKQREEEEKESSLIMPDIDTELSVVPINDTLVLNDDSLKRRALLNLLKTETINNVDILSNALVNNDSETAHYAATAIMEIKRKMLNSIHSLERLANQQMNDVKILTSYAESLKKYVESNLLDEQSKKIYMYKYSSLLERLIEFLPQDKSNYIEKINYDLELNELEKVEYYCKLFIKNCGNEEEAYFSSMKFYYLIKNKEKFDSVILQLKNAPVKISPEGMKLFRFWLNGVEQ
ncbi:hypothetical protein [Peribacillus acanthi]|uniref:hypothetical protein n=1 Tax=Peribacillus acanthi TaxID=2171554 RepID=UPI000D3E93CB|nr:hypothetical protein [Peribacillus acanthi]